MNSARDTLAGGLPHSEIPGSTIARISPGLFAACHVLHRLSVPRHPPDALTLRLSAAPNGKDHIQCSPKGGTAEQDRPRGAAGETTRFTKSAGTPASPGLVIVRQTFLLLKTLCCGTLSRHPPDMPFRACLAAGRARQSNASPGPATVTHTRFFTIINQHMPPAAQRLVPEQFLVF